MTPKTKRGMPEHPSFSITHSSYKRDSTIVAVYVIHIGPGHSDLNKPLPELSGLEYGDDLRSVRKIKLFPALSHFTPFSL